MSPPPVDAVGGGLPVGAPAISNDHAGHGGTGGQSTAPSFSAVYSAALAAVMPAQESAASAGHAHGQPGLTGGSSTAGGQNSLGGHANGGTHNVQETALGLRAYRQQLLASNIANADTPGYKAVDIDFQEAMRLAQSGMQTPPIQLATTASGHIPGQAPATPYNVPLKYRVPSQASADGNTVEMDVERGQFAENAIMYEYSLDRVKGHFMMTLDMLKNLT